MTERNTIAKRSDEILEQQLFRVRSDTDRAFAVLFAAQWIFAVACAFFVTPRTWDGAQSSIHVHVWMSLFVGGLLSVGPITAALACPGTFASRNIVAIAQMLYSALLTHLTGGRIETHFHVFGSLAFLAFYRDWRIFIPATFVIAVDHLARGIFWPQSVFGVVLAAPWRAIEHAGWVIFEDVFLVWGSITATRDLRAVAMTQAELEAEKLTVVKKVEKRTGELQARTGELEAEITRRRLLETQLVQAQKLESIGQLAAGIAHEINTPMQFVCDNIEFLSDSSEKLFEVVDRYRLNLSTSCPGKSWEERRQELDDVTARNQFDMIREQVPLAIAESLEGARRVINIVRAMKEFSHPGQEQKVGIDLNEAVRSTVTITRNRWKYVAELELDLEPELAVLTCMPAEINQVLLNLIVNAADAIAEDIGENSTETGTITVRTRAGEGWLMIEVEDTGCGIPDEIRSRIFDPFFTTKDVGKGSGQGLAICYDVVVNKHQGIIDVDSVVGVGTTFRVCLPIGTVSVPDANSEFDDGNILVGQIG